MKFDHWLQCDLLSKSKFWKTKKRKKWKPNSSGQKSQETYHYQLSFYHYVTVTTTKTTGVLNCFTIMPSWSQKSPYACCQQFSLLKKQLSNNDTDTNVYRHNKQSSDHNGATLNNRHGQQQHEACNRDIWIKRYQSWRFQNQSSHKDMV